MSARVEMIVTNSRKPDAAAGAGAAHPLDPGRAEEIRQVATILGRRQGIGAGLRFASIELKEPGKDASQTPEAGQPGRREALAVCWNTGDGRAYRAVVSLADAAVTAWEHLPGQQPNMTVDEWHEGHEMLPSHPLSAKPVSRLRVSHD